MSRSSRLELTELGVVDLEDSKELREILFEEWEEEDENGAVPLLNSLFALVVEWTRWNGDLVEGKRVFTEECLDKFVSDAFAAEPDPAHAEVLEKIVGLSVWRC